MRSYYYLFVVFLYLLTTSLIGSLISTLAYPTESRWEDGVIKFPVARVNGVTAWTSAERDKMIAEYVPSTNTLLVELANPDQWELNLATCAIKFGNYQEYRDSRTRSGLKRRIREIRQEIESLQDLPASESKDLRDRAQWLKSYFQSLP